MKKIIIIIIKMENEISENEQAKMGKKVKKLKKKKKKRKHRKGCEFFIKKQVGEVGKR